MESDSDDNSNGSSLLDEQDEPTTSAGLPLLDVLASMKTENFEPSNYVPWRPPKARLDDNHSSTTSPRKASTESDSESGSNSSRAPLDEQDEPATTSAKQQPLLDLLALMKSEKFKSGIPDAVAENLLEASGCVTTDPKVTKLVSLAAQKFVAVVARDALQHYKLRGAPQSANRLKGKDGKDEPRNTLTMEDLVSTVEEHGVIVKKPPYFV